LLRNEGNRKVESRLWKVGRGYWGLGTGKKIVLSDEFRVKGKNRREISPVGRDDKRGRDGWIAG